MARQLGLNTSALDARSNAVRAPRPSFFPYKLLMKHLLALGVSLLVLVPAPLAAQTAGSGRRLTVVSAGPTGEVASLAEANEIRIVFSEPMVALGRIPAVVQPPYVTISPAIPGAFRWSGTTILIFTPDAKTPLPFATRYDVTIDASATAVSGRTLGTPYTFGFTTPTVKLLRTETYRRGGRADAPFVVMLRFNQPVEPAVVATQLTAKFDAHDWERPSISPDVQQRLAAIDRTSLERFNAKVAATAAAASSTAPVTLRAHKRLGQEALPAREHARRVRDGDARTVAELGKAHARRRAQVAGRSGNARPRAGIHDEGRTGPLRLGIRLQRTVRSRQPQSALLPHPGARIRFRQVAALDRRDDGRRNRSREAGPADHSDADDGVG